jgi:biotin-(acetyl-CoA carboxylase) ligase
VLGLGVNLNLDRTALANIDHPATSLAVELSSPVDVTHFRDLLQDEFFARYEIFLRTAFGPLREVLLRRYHFWASKSKSATQPGSA